MVIFTNLGIDLMHTQTIEGSTLSKDFDRRVEFIH